MLKGVSPCSFKPPQQEDNMQRAWSPHRIPSAWKDYGPELDRWCHIWQLCCFCCFTRRITGAAAGCGRRPGEPKGLWSPIRDRWYNVNELGDSTELVKGYDEELKRINASLRAHPGMTDVSEAPSPQKSRGRGRPRLLSVSRLQESKPSLWYCWCRWIYNPCFAWHRTKSLTMLINQGRTHAAALFRDTKRPVASRTTLRDQYVWSSDVCIDCIISYREAYLRCLTLVLWEGFGNRLCCTALSCESTQHSESDFASYDRTSNFKRFRRNGRFLCVSSC